MKMGFVEEHYRKNYKHLVNRTMNRVPDNSRPLAEEVVQEAYLRVYKYINTYNPDNKRFDAWFNKILNNCINVCKSVERDKGVVRVSDQALEYIEVIDRVDVETLTFIVRKIKQYEEEDQKILSFYFFEGLSSSEISECTGRSHGAIRMFLHRFTQSIKEK